MYDKKIYNKKTLYQERDHTSPVVSTATSYYKEDTYFFTKTPYFRPYLKEIKYCPYMNYSF